MPEGVAAKLAAERTARTAEALKAAQTAHAESVLVEMLGVPLLNDARVESLFLTAHWNTYDREVEAILWLGPDVIAQGEWQVQLQSQLLEQVQASWKSSSPKPRSARNDAEADLLEHLAYLPVFGDASGFSDAHLRLRVDWIDSNLVELSIFPTDGDTALHVIPFEPAE